MNILDNIEDNFFNANRIIRKQARHTNIDKYCNALIVYTKYHLQLKNFKYMVINLIPINVIYIDLAIRLLDSKNKVNTVIDFIFS